MRRLKLAAVMAVAFALAVQAGGAPLHAQSVKRLIVSTAFSGSNGCSSRSPAFRIRGVPRGTRKLRFNMVDQDKPSYPHGGGTIAYRGGNVPAGAFSYTGPCPPYGETHRYEWTVTALNAAGKVIARGTAVVPFSR